MKCGVWTPRDAGTWFLINAFGSVRFNGKLKILAPCHSALLIRLFSTSNIPPKRPKGSPEHPPPPKNSFKKKAPALRYLLVSKDKVKPKDEQDNTVNGVVAEYTCLCGGKRWGDRITCSSQIWFQQSLIRLLEISSSYQPWILPCKIKIFRAMWGTHS